jgi:hypothetical protein
MNCRPPSGKCSLERSTKRALNKLSRLMLARLISTWVSSTRSRAVISFWFMTNFSASLGSGFKLPNTRQEPSAASWLTPSPPGTPGPFYKCASAGLEATLQPLPTAVFLSWALHSQGGSCVGLA